jgi:hypothetical protein
MRRSLGRGSIDIAARQATMDLPIKLRHLPGRIVAGAFILNSGLNKRHADEGTVARLHGMATGTYPFLGKIPAPLFVKLLSTGEITLGAALLLPLVPSGLAATTIRVHQTARDEEDRPGQAQQLGYRHRAWLRLHRLGRVPRFTEDFLAKLTTAGGRGG